MTIQQAIEKAIEGGWKEFANPDEITIRKGGTNDQIYHYDWAWGFTHTGLPYGLPVSVVLSDPLFWQSLGKAMGWELETRQVGGGDGLIFKWQNEWHKLIDHLIKSGSIESFFDNLN